MLKPKIIKIGNCSARLRRSSPALKAKRLRKYAKRWKTKKTSTCTTRWAGVVSYGLNRWACPRCCRLQRRKKTSRPRVRRLKRKNHDRPWRSLDARKEARVVECFYHKGGTRYDMSDCHLRGNYSTAGRNRRAGMERPFFRVERS